VIRHEGSEEKADSEQGAQEKTAKPESQKATERKERRFARDLVLLLAGAAAVIPVIYFSPLWNKLAILPTEVESPETGGKNGSQGTEILSRRPVANLQLTSPPTIPSPEKEALLTMIRVASVNGGVDKEQEIFAAKHRIEKLSNLIAISASRRREARRHNDAGLTYVKNQQWSEALQAFHAAYQADPSDVEIVHNYGFTGLKIGDLSRAEEWLLSSLFLVPHYGSSWASLSQVYAKQGKKTEALACFANAYRFSLGSQGATSFFQRLAKDPNVGIEVMETAELALQLRFVKEEQEASRNLQDRRAVVKQMISRSLINGGADEEEKIFRDRRLLAAFNAQRPPVHGDETLARQKNEDGREYQQKKKAYGSVEGF
jgi:tetratricopeptide (TPR) repeat protein